MSYILKRLHIHWSMCTLIMHIFTPLPLADFITYLLVCLQIRYFTGNPVHQGTPDQTNGTISNYFKFEHAIDYFKVTVIYYELVLSKIIWKV